MARLHDSIDDNLRCWIADQHIFFVATAPLTGSHVNVSPKGLDTFRILHERSVAYLDLTGSGVETIAHLRENGRITLMFCAFAGPPRILRLYGTGRAILPSDAEFQSATAQFPTLPGIRAVIVVDVERIWTSCGYGVPLLEYQGPRDNLVTWAQRKGSDGIAAYQADENTVSIDGLPGLV